MSSFDQDRERAVSPETGPPVGAERATLHPWACRVSVVGGTGGIRGLLVGSVTTAVVHHAPCSVLVSRTAESEDRVGGHA